MQEVYCIGLVEISQTSANNSPIGLTASPTNKLIHSPKNIKSGTFVAEAHDTTGGVSIFRENGKNYLELGRAFTNSNSSTDLYVILPRSDDVLPTTSSPAYPIKKADYVIIDRLQKYSGSQRYPIANDIKLENYKSAVNYLISNI